MASSEPATAARVSLDLVEHERVDVHGLDVELFAGT
jgi:hypothetical protein